MQEPSTLLVVCLGIGTVFLSLICIIILCKIIGAFCQTAEKTKEISNTNLEMITTTSTEPIQKRQEIIAAISAVIAEELGTDISAIRIHSFKKI